MDLAAASLRLLLAESELRVTPPDRTTQHAAQRLWEEIAGLIRALGVPAARVDDVLQDLYLKTVESLPTNLSGDEARRWLFRVAANRCRLEHRQRSRWQRLLEAFSRSEQSSDRRSQSAVDSEDRERTAEIDAALDRLQPPEREIVVLRYFCNLNSREIGEVLEMPESTVRSHLAKARRQLARDLADWNES
jgi:RNA polymerase sigma factor (sigma-70 family)